MSCLTQGVWEECQHWAVTKPVWERKARMSAWERFLGAFLGVLQASGEQAKTVTFDDTWTTAGSGMRSQPQLQSAQQLSLNLKEGVGTAFPP